jgi:uncharacterized protein YlaI
MGIRFNCEECNKRLNVKSFLAGKRGFCPNCGSRVQIPLEDQKETQGSVANSQQANLGNASQSGSATPFPATQVPSPTAGEAARLSEAEAAAEAEYGNSPSVAPPSVADPIAEMPEAIWYVRPPSGGQYGPAKGDIMRRWIDEGRVSGDSYVWREGWENWQEAVDVFPQLKS